MDTLDKISDLKGEILFNKRNSEQKIDAFKELNQIHEELPFLLPQRYVNFYARFNIYNLAENFGELLNIYKSIETGLAFCRRAMVFSPCTTIK